MRMIMVSPGSMVILHGTMRRKSMLWQLVNFKERLSGNDSHSSPLFKPISSLRHGVVCTLYILLKR